MSTEQNKKIAKEFVEATILRDTDRVAAVLSDDMTLTVQGHHPRFQRTWTKPEWCKYLKTPTPFNDGLSLTIRSLTAEEDRVSLESETYGVISASGKVYNNRYHYLFTIRDGKIATIREYMDTAHIMDVLPFPKM
jgi:ketosteroid isomerase-like protein